MNKSTFLISALASSLLFTGCVGVGPNTQRGAVNGGALGAVAGAVIGNNSRGGNTLGGALIGATVGAIAGGTLGNSVDNQRGTLYSYPEAQGYRSYRYGRVVQAAPPPPPPQVTETVSAPPAPNALWVPGYWAFNGNSYTWLAGHWEIPPPNVRAYVAAHWEDRREGYVYVPSYWR
jgi:Glycine zipper/WXXGXW repeat (2 copies)